MKGRCGGWVEDLEWVFTLNRGESFGEMSLVDAEYVNGFSVVVGKGGAEVVRVDREDLRRVLRVKKS